jgi:GntR family transcriptional regulator
VSIAITRSHILHPSAKDIFEFKAVPVDSASPMPAYVQLEQDLRRQIQSGAQIRGLRLPSEETLARLYGVSRVTLRQALQRLADAGLVSRRHGVGTIITPIPEVTLDLKPMENVTSQLRQVGYSTQVAVLQLGVQGPPKETIDALRLAPGEAAILVRRLVSADGSPVSVISSWVPQTLFPGLETATLSSAEDSLWTLLAANYGHAPARGKNVLEIVYSSAQEADMLRVGFGVPLIKLVCLVSDANDQPIEHSTALWITSKLRLHF